MTAPEDTTRPEPMKFVIFGEWLTVEVGGCTCEGDSHHGHRAGCGLEPVMTLADLDRLMRTSREEWCVFYGGPDPDNAAGTERRDDEADAREHLQWMDAEYGRGVAVRRVYTDRWSVVEGGDQDG